MKRMIEEQKNSDVNEESERNKDNNSDYEETLEKRNHSIS